MRITITAPTVSGATGTPFLLQDDTQPAFDGLSFPNGCGGIGKDGFVPKYSLATEKNEFIEAQFAEELPRGNGQMAYTFHSYRSFKTVDQALAFLADHAPLIPTSGTLAVYIGNTVRYLKNAALKDVTVIEHLNEATGHSYTFVGSYVPPVSAAAGTGTGGGFSAS